MAGQTNRYQIRDIGALTGGLNSALQPDEIADNEMADCKNFTVDESAMITAPGIVSCDSNLLTGPYYAIWLFNKSNGTKVLIRQRQNKLEYSALDSVFFMAGWTECTLPTSGSPATTVTISQITPCFAQLNDKVFWTNGTDTVMSSTDGITWTLEAAHPKARFLINNGYNRLIFAGSSDYPMRIWWTDINDPDTIGASSYQDIDPNTGQRIEGIGRLPSGALVLFKVTGFYYIDDPTLGMVTVSYGGFFRLSSHHSIATTEDSIICGGVDGIYELRDGVMRLISGRILQGGINLTLWSGAFRGCYYKNQYRIATPTSETQTYNAQEYIVYKNLQRNDPVQPYVITRNERQIGCYGVIMDEDSALGRPGAVWVGDSRGATGSPLSGGTLFGWVNDYRQQTYTQGIMGAAQDAYFVTKFFTEDAAFYLKRYVKLFTWFKIQNDLDVTLSYRFLPYGAWIDTDGALETTNIDWSFADGSTGEFSEGYGFSTVTAEEIIIDLEQPGTDPRGIQFKVSTNQTNDVYVLGLAYKFLTKPNMH